MITVLTGENSFENERELRRIVAAFEGRPEYIDGSELELRQLPDLLMGGTLFADKRLVVIKNLSENKALWNEFEEWLARVSDDVHLVLVEPKLDKRTKTYKGLQKMADIRESKAWTDHDTVEAQRWTVETARELGFDLDKKSAHTLVVRVGMDQWQLYRALEKLAVTDTVTSEIVEEFIEANPTENIFNLFEAALKKDPLRVKNMLEILEVTEDPYRLFGLLSGQAFQLAALSVSDKSHAEVAKDLGAYPFALSKLAPYAKKLGRAGGRKIIRAFAEADEAMKTSAGDPWLLIERALIKITRL